MLLWIPSDGSYPRAIGEEDLGDLEHWRVKHMCRTPSASEIYDLAWSPDATFFILGSMDNCARIYNAQTGKSASLVFWFTIRHRTDSNAQVPWSGRLQNTITSFRELLGIL